MDTQEEGNGYQPKKILPLKNTLIGPFPICFSVSKDKHVVRVRPVAMSVII